MEPGQVFANTTWQWTASFRDYDATAGWTLTYELYPREGGEKKQIATTPDGSGWKVDLTPAETITYTPGVWTWRAVMVLGPDTFVAATGNLTVHPDPTAASAGDLRSHYELVLAAIEAVLEDRATVEQSQIEVAGDRLSRRSMEELLQLQSRYMQLLAGAKDAEGLAGATKFGKTVQTRFGPGHYKRG